MATWITRCLGALTVGGPSLVLCGGLIDWKEGVKEQLGGLDKWMESAWKRGGGKGDFKQQAQKLRGNLTGGSHWEHPGMYVESIGNYMKRVLEKANGQGKVSGVTYEFTGKEQLIEKVGFTKDKNTGKLRLALKLKDKGGSKNRWISNGGGLCVLSVDKKDGSGGGLDFVIGFYSALGKGITGQDANGENILLSSLLSDSKDKLVSGYEDWCERRAKRFDKENNLLIGVPINVLDTDIGWDSSKSKVNKITYKESTHKHRFVGMTSDNNSQKFIRVYATKSDTDARDQGIYPVVLGLIGNKKFEGNQFTEGAKVDEKLSEIAWGDDDDSLIAKEWEKKNSKKWSERQCKNGREWSRGNRCPRLTWEEAIKELTTKDAKEPLGVKFSNPTFTELNPPKSLLLFFKLFLTYYPFIFREKI